MLLFVQSLEDHENKNVKMKKKKKKRFCKICGSFAGRTAKFIRLIWAGDELPHTHGEEAEAGMREFSTTLSDKPEIWSTLVNQKEHIHFLH